MKSLFGELLELNLLKYCEEDFFEIKSLWEKCGVGLRLSRCGRLKEAKEVFEKVKLSIEYGLFDSESEQFANIIFYASSAYYEYRTGNINKALLLIESANACDNYLINVGFDFMHAHRIQLMHNVIRLEKFKRNYIRAIGYCTTLIDHLRGETGEGLPLEGDWSINVIVAVPRELVLLLQNQIESELESLLEES